MTPLGHFATCGLVAGMSGVVSRKTTWKVAGFYAATMIPFAVWTHFFSPGMSAMNYVDWMGNLAGLFVLAWWWRTRSPESRSLLVILVGSQLLAGFSHTGDLIMLHVAGYIPAEGMWRPHHIWHTPVFALVYCGLTAHLVSALVGLKSAGKAFLLLLLGYLLHVVGDTLTYDFPIYWLWPFSDFGAMSLAKAWMPSTDCAGFGNALYTFGASEHNPKWGFTIYTAEPLVNALLFVLFALRGGAQRFGITNGRPS